VGSNELVTELSPYTSGALYHQLTAFYIDMELFTSKYMLLPIIDASGFMYNFQMCVLGPMFGGYNCSVAVD